MNEKDVINRVLIIEDDGEIAEILGMNIKDLGLEPIHISDGKSGLKEAISREYALIILDLMLPQLDGISLCSKLRKTDPYTPILILSAKGEEIDRVLGLELGADDYMTKPFSLRELTARIKALLRRSQVVLNKEDNNQLLAPIKIGDLIVDIGKHKAWLKNIELLLTVKEFSLLSLFAQNQGRAYTRTELLNLVWGYQFQGYEHTVNTHINRLRGKIEDDSSHPRYLKTVWGIGYRFTEDSELDQ